MEPNSILLVVVLLLAAVAGIVAAVRVRLIAVQVVAGLLTLVLAAFSGMAIVNDYYAYYQTWGQLSADLSGNYSSFSGSTTAARSHVAPVGQGRVQTLTLAGARSGITRQGLVYLPPQYDEPAYAHTYFPVVELLHGSPGTPQNWIVQMRVARVLDDLIATHRMGPVIAVIPAIAVGSHYEECVNAPGALDDTYLTQDVRDDVLARFRASPVAAEWGVAGYSSGGYCAANLTLRHRAAFGAAGVMDGYFRPTDGPAAAALHDNAAAEQANDPLLAARRLPGDVHPLPSYWLMAGTADAGDYAGAQAFVRALHGLDEVVLHPVRGATHNYDAWRAADPAMLSWLWTQLAPPQLRVQFPVSAPVGVGTVRAHGGRASTAPGHPRVRRGAGRRRG